MYLRGQYTSSIKKYPVVVVVVTVVVKYMATEAIFFTAGRRWVEKPLARSFEPRFESRRQGSAE